MNLRSEKEEFDEEHYNQLIQLIKGDEIMERAFKECETLSNDSTTMLEYEQRRMAILDENSRINGVRKEGVAEGYAEAVKKAINKGLPDEQIMDLFELSLLELEQIRKDS